MSLLSRSFFLVAVLLCLPGLALAQVRYEMLTLAEAAYLYSGLALQAVLRNSSLRHLPQVIMVCCTMWLVYRRVTSPRPQPFTGIVAYLVSCGLILVLFWPEAAPRFFGGGGVTIERVTAVGITSYIPQANSMPRINAAQSGMVPVGLRANTVVPRAFHLILSAVTEMPLLLARGIHADDMERPFSRVAVMNEFVEQVETNPPPVLRARIPDFVEQCYTPALEKLLQSKPNPTFQERMPWSSDMTAILTKIRIPGRRGIPDDLGTAPSPTPTTCQAMYQSMQTGAVQYLRGQQTAQGSNQAQVVLDHMGITATEHAQIFVSREMERQMETVHGPHRVVNAKRSLDVSGGLLSALTNFDITAPLKSTGAQLEKHLDRMSRFLGIGSFLVYWGPYLVGIAMFVILSFFPVVLLWSLFPGQHFKPLVNYFLLLVFVCSTPLWWAMVDGAAEVAYAQHPPSGWMGAPGAWGLAYTSYMVVTVLGIILVPILQATLIFGTWRAIGGIWGS